MCGLSPGYKVSGRLSVKLKSVDLMGREFTVVDQPRLRGWPGAVEDVSLGKDWVGSGKQLNKQPALVQ